MVCCMIIASSSSSSPSTSSFSSGLFLFLLLFLRLFDDAPSWVVGGFSPRRRRFDEPEFLLGCFLALDVEIAVG